MDDLRRNGEGYYDPTPYEVITNIEKKEVTEFTTEKKTLRVNENYFLSV